MNVCLQEKLRENKKDDLSNKKKRRKKTCKDNLRTLFVEIPSSKGAVDRAASFRVCPAKSDFNPSQPPAQTSSNPTPIFS